MLYCYKEWVSLNIPLATAIPAEARIQTPEGAMP
jgi:hypothetical protein